MRRRDAIILAASAACLRPLASLAQSPKKLPVVGFVLAESAEADMAGPDPKHLLARAFVHRMHDLGWVDGRTIVIERRSPEGRPERAPAIVADLIARGVDMLVVGAAPWLQHAASAAARDIPIVASFSTIDPMAEGLIASLARPGGNLTGVTANSGYGLMTKRLQLLKELAPGIARVGLLGRRAGVEEHLRHFATFGLTGIFVEVDRADQLEDALATMLRERVDALHVITSATLYTRVARVVSFAAEHRLPTMFAQRESVEAGGLMSYGASTPELFRQMAGYVDRILKGARPADLAVEQPTRYELLINLKTARALGLSVPPLLLAQADETIE